MQGFDGFYEAEAEARQRRRRNYVVDLLSLLIGGFQQGSVVQAEEVPHQPINTKPSMCDAPVLSRTLLCFLTTSASFNSAPIPNCLKQYEQRYCLGKKIRD
jgi:hypothetical protein